MSELTRTNFGLTWEVTLTDAQIKTLPTIPVTVIPPQGSGVLVFPMFSVLRIVAAAAYTNIDATALLWIGEVGGDGVLAQLDEQTTGSKVSSFLNTGSRARMMAPYANIEGAATYTFPGHTNDTAMCKGIATKLFINNAAAGNLTGGNSANVMTVTTFFNIFRD